MAHMKKAQQCIEYKVSNAASERTLELSYVAAGPQANGSTTKLVVDGSMTSVNNWPSHNYLLHPRKKMVTIL